jgi:hypothetical protein
MLAPLPVALTVSPGALGSAWMVDPEDVAAMVRCEPECDVENVWSTHAAVLVP